MTVPFTQADVRRAAAPRSFERGQGYVDRVSGIDVGRERASATVYGSDLYLVTLTWVAGALDGACTCPHGEEGHFCKHCVALGLRLLGMGESATRLISAGEKKRTEIEDWLRALPHEELVADLLGLIDGSPELRLRYELRLASSSTNIQDVRNSLHDLLDVEHGGAAGEYPARVAAAASAIRGLVNAGKAHDAIELAQEALGLFADSYEMVNWSDDLVYELSEAHLLACGASPPDVRDLALFLADLMLRDDYGAVPVIEEYADLLGDTGQALIRERIAEAFERDPGNWVAKRLLEEHARADGDVDALVALYAANLNDRGTGHMCIVRELDSAGRDQEALSWAERGLGECESPSDDLVNYVAGRYASAGRDDDVLELRRARFGAARVLANYRALRQAAQACGDWPSERDAALARLRTDASRASTASGPVLVDALIDDGDFDAAWEAAAGKANEMQMLRLADASASARPADALAAYLTAIAPLYQLTGDDAYKRMARLLLSARACHERLGTLEEFEGYVEVIRTDLKRRRNLIRILDENGL